MRSNWLKPLVAIIAVGVVVGSVLATEVPVVCSCQNGPSMPGCNGDTLTCASGLTCCCCPAGAGWACSCISETSCQTGAGGCRGNPNMDPPPGGP